jgi:putative endonuclease
VEIVMYYVYILRKYEGSEIYIGYTSDLKRRFKEHNTKSRSWELVYYEAYKARKDARIREERLKYYGQALR